MRKTFLSLLLVIAASCDQERVDLKHVSQIETRTKGISFVDEDNSVDMGMAGNTCRFDVGNGMITTDADVVQGEDDTVADAFLGNTIVISRSGGFVVSDSNRNPDFVHVFPGRNVTDARFTQEGVIALIRENNDCQLGYYTPTSETSLFLEGDCPNHNQIDVRRDSETSFFVADAGVKTYSAYGAEYFAPKADAIKWDATTQALYATSNGRDMTAYNIDGSVRWTTSLDGFIKSFDDMGVSEAVIVMLEVEDNKGALVILDSLTGQVKKTFPTPTAASDVIMSQDGKTLAVALENETHFFTINTDF